MAALVRIMEDINKKLQGKPAPKVLIFVYGTLKRNGSLNSHLHGQEFVAEATTQALYRMYRHQDGWYPILVEDENGIEIEGEVWRVSQDVIPVLDRVEGDEYQRTVIRLKPPFDEELVKAWVYDGKVRQDELPELGPCWRASNGTQ